MAARGEWWSGTCKTSKLIFWQLYLLDWLLPFSFSALTISNCDRQFCLFLLDWTFDFISWAMWQQWDIHNQFDSCLCSTNVLYFRFNWSYTTVFLSYYLSCNVLMWFAVSSLLLTILCSGICWVFFCMNYCKHWYLCPFLIIILKNIHWLDLLGFMSHCGVTRKGTVYFK